MPILERLDLMQIVAIWGAITGTVALAWKIIEWRKTKSSLLVGIRAICRTFGEEGVEIKRTQRKEGPEKIHITKNRLYVRVGLLNKGEDPTNLEYEDLSYFSHFIWRYVRLSKFIVKLSGNFEIGDPSPYGLYGLKLEPHDKVWRDFTFINIPDLRIGGYILYEVKHTYDSRPIRKYSRVYSRENSPEARLMWMTRRLSRKS
jgi:hypothetical protein